MAGESEPDESAHAQTIDNGVVINELLCFVYNKLDILPMDTITRLCDTHYNSVDIEIAKRKLNEVCPTDSSRRIPNRKGPKKNIQNMDDIVKRMFELDASGTVTPCFVARNRSNLPPVTFDSVDVSALLTKMERIGDEVKILRAGVEAQHVCTEDLTNVCAGTISRLTSLEQVQPVSDSEWPKLAKVTTIPSSDQTPALPVAAAPVTEAGTSTSMTPAAQTFVQPATVFLPPRAEPPSTSNSKDHSWSTVAKRGVKRSPVQKQNKRIIGSATVQGITAATKRGKRANIFATRFAPDQCPDKLKQYLDNKLNANVTCTRLASKYPDSYSSFYVSAEIAEPTVFLDSQLWPEGIYVRWFRPVTKSIKMTAVVGSTPPSVNHV